MPIYTVVGALCNIWVYVRNIMILGNDVGNRSAFALPNISGFTILSLLVHSFRNTDKVSLGAATIT